MMGQMTENQKMKSFRFFFGNVFCVQDYQPSPERKLFVFSLAVSRSRTRFCLLLGFSRFWAPPETISAQERAGSGSYS